MQKFGYHCHTTFSDGVNTAEEMIEKAVSLGWEEIGLSDHFQVHKSINNALKSNTHPFRSKDFVSAKDWIKKRVDYLRDISKNYPIKLRVGFEVDFFTYEGWEEDLKDFFKDVEVDYLISGNHFVFDEGCNNLVDLREISVFVEDKKTQQEMLRRHFQTIKKSIDSKIFSFLAHMDYARWSFISGDDDYKKEKLEILDSLEKTNTAIELNTKGMRSIKDFYPSRWILEEIKDRDISVVLSDDAHHRDYLGQFFEQAEAYLKEIGITNRFKL